MAGAGREEFGLGRSGDLIGVNAVTASLASWRLERKSGDRSKGLELLKAGWIPPAGSIRGEKLSIEVFCVEGEGRGEPGVVGY